MSKIYIYTSILLVATLVLFNCGGSDSGGDDDGGKILAPTASTLISPLNHEECNQGNVVSETESNVKFDWSGSDNTNSYTLVLTNLNTNTSQESITSDKSITIKILRGVPYSWYVISKSKKTVETATSETWNFYNAGEGVSNYAPFPAEVLSPSSGAIISGNTVSIKWKGSDIDNDISAYDVYLDTANPPSKLQQADVTTEELSNISISANTTYYWRVVSKDEANNTSKSQIFEFTTE